MIWSANAGARVFPVTRILAEIREQGYTRSANRHGGHDPRAVHGRGGDPQVDHAISHRATRLTVPAAIVERWWNQVISGRPGGLPGGPAQELTATASTRVRFPRAQAADQGDRCSVAKPQTATICGSAAFCPWFDQLSPQPRCRTTRSKSPPTAVRCYNACVTEQDRNEGFARDRHSRDKRC